MDPATVLVVNAGSGSLALDVVGPRDDVRDSTSVDAAPDSDEAREALADFLRSATGVDAVGHRIVHGGPDLRGAVRVEERVRSQLERAADLAPLHVPPALGALDACSRALPDLPQVVCLDTAFHADLPEAARTYPVPGEWRERYGVRRYGFHGLSYAWALRRTGEMLGRPASELQVVLAHLGGGASVCAVSEGRSVWTSMGFTPLEGLVMVSRSGSLDPGMLLWLQTFRGLGAAEVSDALEHRSGLVGLSDGLSGDTRELVSAAAQGSAPARLALDVYCLRARQEIAAAAACLERLDALVFTGQIGVDTPEVREAVAEGLPVLGLTGGLDPLRDGEGVVSAAGARVPVLVVAPREELQIAREVRGVLDARPRG